MSNRANLREVIRCQHCKLNQFAQVNRLCRRCQGQLADPPPPPMRQYKSRAMPAAATLAARVRNRRIACNLSQTQLAKRVGCPRTYISKIETTVCSPYLAQLRRLAVGLGCDMADILPIAPEPTWGELHDPGMVEFMHEMFEQAPQLDKKQRKAVVHEAKKKHRECLDGVNDLRIERQINRTTCSKRG